MLKLSKSNWSSKFSHNQLQPTWTEASHNPKFSSNDHSQVDKRRYDDDNDDDAFMDSDEKGQLIWVSFPLQICKPLKTSFINSD